MINIAMISAAIPEKIAPTTKYGPKIVLCHMGWSVMENTNDTTVCTETAIGTTRIVMIPMPRCSTAICLSLPVHPSARIW